MALNTHFASTPAQHRSLPVPDGTKSGDPVKVGSLVGVALTDRAKSPELETDFGNGNREGYATVARDGAWKLTVTGAVTQIGAPVYISGTGTLSVTAGSDTLFGYALGLKDAAAGIVVVEIAKV